MTELILVGLIALLGFIIYKLWTISAKQSITFSALITDFLKTNTGDVLFTLILTSSCAEAILAMSLKDENAPTEARILLHISMFLFGIVGTTMLSRSFTDAFKMIKAKRYGLFLANVLILIPGSIFLAFGGPIVNLMVILKLGGDTAHAIILIAKIQHFLGVISYAKLNYIITTLGYDPITYNIFALSSANAQASLFLVGAHFVAVLANVIYAYVEKITKPKAKVIPIESKESKEKETENKKETQSEKLPSEQHTESYTLQNLETILKFLNYPDYDKANTMSILANKIRQYANPSAETIERTVAIANTIATLTGEIQSFTGSEEDKAKLVNKVITALRKSPEEGGLGVMLKYYKPM